ncbi:sodium-dependent transporter [Candidatus Calescamantes bacterium]|nr:sodium-dependent transporter [Candidatus Calescamantes bacterium]
MAERERWSSRVAFVMATVGSAVGLGNLWRFPYICYKNGGGAFLIPYFVALFTAGIPLMILEFSLGHKFQGSAPHSFSCIRKKWEWLGWWALLIGFVITTYYNVVIAWSVDYLFYSIPVSWGDNAKDFFFKKFLQVSSSPLQLGGIRIPILLAALGVWLSIYLIIYKGVERVGKVVLFTVPLPVILLIILIIRGMTLPGAIEGVKFYLTPDFSKLADPKVWLAAYAQIFFSLSLAFGILIAYSSYLPSHHDINNSAFIISLTNCGTSFLAGFAVFPVLGYLAHVKGVPIEKVVASGPGLAFIAYPTALKLLPFAIQFFSFLFFLLLISLGIDSAFSLVEAVVTGVMDKWKLNRHLSTTLVCIPGIIIGILFTTRAGLLWLDIIDDLMTSFGLTSVGLLQCILVGYIYGAEEMRKYANSVSDFPIGKWWNFCVRILTPIILAISIILVLQDRIKSPYGGYPYPALFCGWGIFFSLIVIALWLASRRGR